MVSEKLSVLNATNLDFLGKAILSVVSETKVNIMKHFAKSFVIFSKVCQNLLVVIFVYNITCMRRNITFIKMY